MLLDFRDRTKTGFFSKCILLAPHFYWIAGQFLHTSSEDTSLKSVHKMLSDYIYTTYYCYAMLHEQAITRPVPPLLLLTPVHGIGSFWLVHDEYTYGGKWSTTSCMHAFTGSSFTELLLLPYFFFQRKEQSINYFWQYSRRRVPSFFIFWTSFSPDHTEE